MTVSQIGENKIKVTLSDTEVLSCFGAYERLLSMTDSVKPALNALLRDIVSDLGVTNGKRTVLASIRVKKHQGCEIILSVLRARDNAEKEYLLVFDSSEELTEGILTLFCKRNTKHLKSSLYKMPKAYRLIVKTSEKSRLYIMNEYCSRITSSETEVAYTREYGKPLIENNAVEVYGRAFFKVPS